MTLRVDEIRCRGGLPHPPRDTISGHLNINAKRIVRVRGELQERFKMAGVSSMHLFVTCMSDDCRMRLAELAHNEDPLQTIGNNSIGEFIKRSSFVTITDDKVQ
jgi:hypothetical protein